MCSSDLLDVGSLLEGITTVRGVAYGARGPLQSKSQLRIRMRLHSRLISPRSSKPFRRPALATCCESRRHTHDRLRDRENRKHGAMGKLHVAGFRQITVALTSTGVVPLFLKSHTHPSGSFGGSSTKPDRINTRSPGVGFRVALVQLPVMS